MFSTSGDIMSTSGDVQYIGGLSCVIIINIITTYYKGKFQDIDQLEY